MSIVIFVDRLTDIQRTESVNRWKQVVKIED